MKMDHNKKTLLPLQVNAFEAIILQNPTITPFCFYPPFSAVFEMLSISAGGDTFAIIECDFHNSEHIYPLSAKTQRLKNMPSVGSEKQSRQALETIVLTAS
ncbi:hypothetical protein CDAR_588311 [Caerostris darwini]|uniref:Uncharacterized protein n=1 Tax=Caerostris darwini TaxID=1538125 RepID=A0AAV4S7Z5_9ARAC|nr:hypothetical protein CDAR_588311 [Caerostris darwini]